MAKGKNEILLSIALEGDQEIKQKLKAVGEAGKQSLADIERQVGSAGSGFGKRLAGAVDSAALGRQIREAFAPLTEASGLGGVLGAGAGLFSRLGGAAGPAAFIAGLTGIAVHLANVREESEKTQKRLQAFGGGNDALDQLRASEKRSGTPSGQLQDSFEEIIKTRDEARSRNKNVITAPGFEPRDENLPTVIGAKPGPLNISNEAALKALETLENFGRVEQADAAKRKAANDEFVKGLTNSHLTGDVLRTLRSANKTEADKVATAVGLPNATKGADILDQRGPIDASQVLRKLSDQQPESQKLAEESRGLSDAFNNLKGSVQRADEAFGKAAGGPANKALTGGIDAVTRQVDKIPGLVEDTEANIRRNAAAGADLGRKTGIPGAETAGQIGGGVLGVSESIAEGLRDKFVPESVRRAVTTLPSNTLNDFATSDAAKLMQEKAQRDQEAFERQRAASPPIPVQPVLPSGAPPQQLQQGASAFDSFIENLNVKLNNLNPQNLKVPAEETGGIGIRGSVEDSSKNVASSIDQVDGSLKQLAQAIVEAAGEIKAAASGAKGASPTTQNASSASSGQTSGSSEAQVEVATGGMIRRLEPGGHVSGPGTSTSDSIPAMLSDGEYVIRAESARKLGRGALDRINAGHFARGGSVARLAGGGLSSEWFDPDLTDEESIQLLNETVLSPQQLRLVALNNAKTPEESIKLLNRFIMHRSGGGPIGHFASGGVANFGDSIGHLFAGGGAAADAPSLGHLGTAGGIRELHPVTINMPGGNAVGPMLADSAIVNAVRREARDGANYQTGPSPSWAHGGSR